MAQAINTLVEKGLRDRWDSAGPEPEAPAIEHLCEAAVVAIREANRKGRLAELREFWPPYHSALIEHLEKHGRAIPVVCLLADGSIVARIGAPYEDGEVMLIQGNRAQVVPDVPYFGRCPNRRYFGLVRHGGIEVTDGWGGATVGYFPWPTGVEDMPTGCSMEPWDFEPKPSVVIPFPDMDERIVLLEDGSRVYAGASRHEELIIGDASGYVRAFSLSGERRWQQFSGSSVGSIDVSPDGRTMVATTCAGFLSNFQLDAGYQAPHQIGDGNHLEQRRWIFWKGEETALIW